ncbi:MAG: polysaccharide biosynthesis/export family protein [Desulfobacteraceae bacterium]|nr:polysaccharide biosynthesis/export family protein [Desulfobacteraceae bacterium]
MDKAKEKEKSKLGAFVRTSPMKTFALVLAVLSGLLTQSCASTAVKGTPVKELGPITAGVRVKKIPEKARIEELAVMSKVKGNRVFQEIDGIAEYRIGPLDLLEISSHVGSEVSTTNVRVDNRGRISYSFIDDLDVAGLPPSQLDELLTNKLSSYIKNPRVDVLVNECKSKSALVMGEFASLRRTQYIGEAGSGKIYLPGKTTLMDLVALAGGYTVDADIKNLKLIRQGETYVINLYNIIEKGDGKLNVIVDDGDIIDIPELPRFGERVYVMGEVNMQGIYALKDAQDLLGAVSLAGSFTPLAKEENTLIVRADEPGVKPLVMMADLKALLRQADIAQNIALQDGDLVYVPSMVIGDINEWINNAKPLLDILLYPADFEARYFLRRYLHFDRGHPGVDRTYFLR